MRVAATTGLADTKAVENCACAARNLCFGLGEATKPLDSHPLKRTLRNVHNKAGEAPEPVSNASEAILWHPDAVTTFLALLRRASNPVCIEAAAGAIQNLTSSAKWRPAEVVRSEVG
ncbi:Plakophilin-4 [Taenia solium]|eukprot:TsM_001087800 transcript=TsM_001087800 gene=TsM_001087800